jgi:predicted nucleotide-binding protein
MSSKTVFYSWQSDLDKKKNNFFIKNALEKAIKKINREVELTISLDKDTQSTSGSPDIVDTIFRKIRGSEIFVCDVTIINNGFWRWAGKFRKTPNPNVLIELGYAVKTLGWERVICVVNTDECKIEELPFDIRNNRTATYAIGSDKKAAEVALTGTLTAAIKAILDNYEKIIANLQKDDALEHDKVNFYHFDALASQVQIFESIQFLGANLRMNDHYYHRWDRVEEFHKALQHHFLNKDIQNAFHDFVVLLDKLHLLAVTKLHSERTPGQTYEIEYTEQNIEITPEIRLEIEQSQRYRYPDGPSDGNWTEFNKRMYATQDEFNDVGRQVKEAYTKFRLAIKQQLFI